MLPDIGIMYMLGCFLGVSFLFYILFLLTPQHLIKSIQKALREFHNKHI